jgi:uncharacterized membrane protein
LAILVVLAVVAATAFAWAPAMAAGDPAPALEQIGDVQTVTPSEVEGKPSDVGDLVGRLHPALVHFPIAWLVGLAIIDFFGLVCRRAKWQRVGVFLLAGTVLSLLPTAATGLLRAAHMPSDATTHALLVTHRSLNFAVAGLVLAAFALRLWRRNCLQGWWRISYLVLLFAATGMVLLAAHFGGRMVYGPDYLPWWPRLSLWFERD